MDWTVAHTPLGLGMASFGFEISCPKLSQQHVSWHLVTMPDYSQTVHLEESTIFQTIFLRRLSQNGKVKRFNWSLLVEITTYRCPIGEAKTTTFHLS